MYYSAVLYLSQKNQWLKVGINKKLHYPQSWRDAFDLTDLRPCDVSSWPLVNTLLTKNMKLANSAHTHTYTVVTVCMWCSHPSSADKIRDSTHTFTQMTSSLKRERFIKAVCDTGHRKWMPDTIVPWPYHDLCCGLCECMYLYSVMMLY